MYYNNAPNSLQSPPHCNFLQFPHSFVTFRWISSVNNINAPVPLLSLMIQLQCKPVFFDLPRLCHYYSFDIHYTIFTVVKSSTTIGHIYFNVTAMPVLFGLLRLSLYYSINKLHAVFNSRQKSKYIWSVVTSNLSLVVASSDIIYAGRDLQTNLNTFNGF